MGLRIPNTEISRRLAALRLTEITRREEPMRAAAFARSDAHVLV